MPSFAADETVIDGVRVVVRHPRPSDWERQHVWNDDSIVLELLWRDVSLVLTGDAGAEPERLIAPEFQPSPLRIIKVPHHRKPHGEHAAVPADAGAARRDRQCWEE
jgi:beta-lactamase superfamily II metal-dependent hydrolase